ncbi:AtzE family amidohydrolase [Horticoccus sp. 23ND18S-11]|uniref:AtzE family amidohydrolase n=1 Tax=Horticoccus sp. 23ND18S-11 TaxID=3391832 RepID=UPI0039C9E0BD
MSAQLASLSGLETAAAIRSGQVNARRVVESALERIAATHGAINAFTSVTMDRARREAAAVDDAFASRRDPGPLAGVPFAVKNLFDLTGVVTVAGSKINRHHPAATSDATAVERLCRAGAVCVGALNMGEYAYDFVTDNAHDGATRNPHDLARSAGGSSGGCGAAVAAGLVPIALGTDTNGSIRVPSSFCGIWGLKPTYGRLSRAGSFPFVESLDHIGPFARTVADLAVAYDAMQGPDPRDPACAQRPVDAAAPHLDTGLGDLRVALLGGYFERGCPPQAHAAAVAVANALSPAFRGGRVELPQAAHARAAAFLITATEGGSLHLDRLRKNAAYFDPKIRDRFLAGALTPAAWYLHAQRFRAWFRAQVREVFRHVDVLIAPATPVPATFLGQELMTIEGVELPVRPNLGLFTQPISFIGLPVVAAPVHTAGPQPIAVQLIAAPWRETALLRVARVLEHSGVCTAPVARLAA